MAAETTFMGGNSYGPEPATVQFAVAPQDGALGTIFVPAARRINKISIKNEEGVSVTIKVQENDNLGATGWSDVGSPVTIVPGGTQEIDVSGLIEKPYARLYGGPTVANAGSSICRATINDLDLIDHFRQNKPYGAG